MSLFGTLNTAVSGMAAQASYLSAVGDNIANASTTGYKSADVQFQTLLGNQATSNYQSGGVTPVTRYGIANQGAISGTSNVTDLAVQGGGFFVVQGPSGTPVMTRAGSFVADANGNLVNSAGFKLMAYNLTDGSQASANGVGGLELVNVNGQALSAAPSTAGTLGLNLPSNDAIVPTTATANNNTLASSAVSYSGKTSLVSYDNLGNAVNLDIYFSKTAANTWQADVYNHGDAASTGGFPYAAAALTTTSLSFDPTNGSLLTGSPLTVAIPNGNPALTIDVSKSTQLATSFNINTATVDGSSPSTLDHIAISQDGTITSVYKNGIQKSTYQIPLATVTSPDQLTPLSGNVYEASLSSGEMIIGKANSGPFGAIDSSSLEQSTADIATQLTDMITAQRSYEANSKVIQTSSQLLQSLIQIVGQ